MPSMRRTLPRSRASSTTSSLPRTSTAMRNGLLKRALLPVIDAIANLDAGTRLGYACVHVCMYVYMYGRVCFVCVCVYVCVCVCVCTSYQWTQVDCPVCAVQDPCESWAQPTGHSKLLAAQECRDKDRARSLLIRGRKTDLKRSVTDSAFRKAKSAETYRQTRLRV